MKTLIMTGLGCPKHAWHKIFPANESLKIISLAEVLDKYPENDLRILATSLEKDINEFKPDLMILHDFGVLFGLLALLGLKKKKAFIPAKLVIFNGSLRGFNVYKQRHPFKMQFASFDFLKRAIRHVGGELDENLQPHFNRIKKFYRQIILASTLALIKKLFTKMPPANFDLGNHILIIASANDPFIPLSSLKQIAIDFKNTTLEIVNYGHFPYSGDCDYLRNRVELFALEK